MPDVGLLIIDGFRDLMYDINSPSESTDLINLLMRWSSGYNLHIHTVLHLNKGDDNTRGHIGTELNNKAETVLQITKSTQDGNISEVKAMHIIYVAGSLTRSHFASMTTLCPKSWTVMYSSKPNKTGTFRLQS